VSTVTPSDDLNPSPLASVKGEGSSLLDGTHQNCTLEDLAWIRKQAYFKRRRGKMFQRSMSGIRLGGTLKLVTLTTSLESWDAGKDIQASFRALVMRLRRRGLCSGYVKVREYTRAGLPHLHVILRGPWLPVSWLSRVWAEIHLSPIVDIRAVRGSVGAASYLAKYMGKDERARYSWSWDWVWRGFAGDWRQLCKQGYRQGMQSDAILRAWNTGIDYFARTGERLALYGRGV